MTRGISNYIDERIDTYYNQPVVVREEYTTAKVGDVVMFDLTESFFYEMQDNGLIPMELEYDEYYILSGVEGNEAALLNVTDKYSIETFYCPLEVLVSVDY